MAVDANVLIYSRIREELAERDGGPSVRSTRASTEPIARSSTPT